MSKSRGIWDTILKVVIAGAAAGLGVLGANARTLYATGRPVIDMMRKRL